MSTTPLHSDECHESTLISNQSDVTDPHPIHEPDEFAELKQIVLDSGRLHTVCLEAFRAYSKGEDCILTEADLGGCINYVCSQCGLDPLDSEEISELWSGKLNFAEFYMVSHELLKSIYQTVNLDAGCIVAVHEIMKK